MYLIRGGNTQHKKGLVMVAILAKLLILGALILFFNTFVDLYDYTVYLGAIQNVMQGLLPWENGVIFYYPPLGLIPCFILYPIFLLAGSGWFFVALTLFMIACDCVTTLGVYHLGCKLYEEKYAFRAALLSATGLSMGYYVLCRMDPFIICLAVLALCFSFDNERIKGYYLILVGFFSKLYPIVFYPFLILHHEDWRQPRPLAILSMGAAFFGVMVLLGYNAFLVYVQSIYVQTIPHVVFILLGANSPFPYESVVKGCLLLAVFIIAEALFYVHNGPKTIRITTSMILLSLCAIILLSNYRSPQYIVWVSPLFALLIADDPIGIIEYYLLQVISFVEFPLGFNYFYTNGEYLLPWAPWFFCLLFAAWAALLYRVLQRMDNIGGGTNAS